MSLQRMSRWNWGQLSYVQFSYLPVPPMPYWPNKWLHGTPTNLPMHTLWICSFFLHSLGKFKFIFDIEENLGHENLSHERVANCTQNLHVRSAQATMFLINLNVHRRRPTFLVSSLTFIYLLNNNFRHFRAEFLQNHPPTLQSSSPIEEKPGGMSKESQCACMFRISSVVVPESAQ